MKDVRGYQQKNGNFLAWSEWYSIGDGISIMPMKGGRHKIRLDQTGDTHKAPGSYGPAADTLMMALYLNEVPRGYAAYCFGSDFKG